MSGSDEVSHSDLAPSRHRSDLRRFRRGLATDIAPEIHAAICHEVVDVRVPTDIGKVGSGSSIYNQGPPVVYKIGVSLQNCISLGLKQRSISSRRIRKIRERNYGQ